jgi:hypothetical protein
MGFFHAYTSSWSLEHNPHKEYLLEVEIPSSKFRVLSSSVYGVDAHDFCHILKKNVQKIIDKIDAQLFFVKELWCSRLLKIYAYVFACVKLRDQAF